MVHPDKGILFRVKNKWAIRSQKTQRTVKCILLNERNWSEMITHCIIPSVWHPGKGKTKKAVKIWGVARGLGRRDE